MDSVKDEQNEGSPSIVPDVEERPRYKSYRKKYRKMKLQFDEIMEDANQLFVAENTAWEIAKRIQEQNDQLMDIIVAMNNSTSTPGALRYNIFSPPPGSVPDLETDRSETGEHHPATNDRSLSTLSKTTHTPFDLPDLDKLPPELLDLDSDLPPGYLTSQHEQEYLAALDNSLAIVRRGSEVDAARAEAFSVAKERTIPTERDFALHHPGSVYNWLRLHQPQVFDTKDKESEKGDIIPTKSKGKKEKALKQEYEGLDEDELLELGLGGGLGSVKAGKKKKDDESYRPKGGHSRPSKRKRDKDDGDGKAGKKPRKSGTTMIEGEI